MNTKTQFIVLTLLALSALPALNARAQQFVTYTSDANTVLLDTFNGSTLGTVGGTVSYINGPSGLGQAIDFSQGGGLQYGLNVNGWNGSSGTIEELVYLTSYAVNMQTWQWNHVPYSGSRPAAGYILGYSPDSQGQMQGSSWPGGAITGNSVIPLDTWTDITVSWDPSGSALYINGALDATGPAMSVGLAGWVSSYYITMGTWGGMDNFTGAIDEIRVENTYKTPLVTPVPEPSAFALAGLGALLLYRRKK